MSFNLADIGFEPLKMLIYIAIALAIFMLASSNSQHILGSLFAWLR
ncbi:MAG TPA: hypothetical protein VI979_00975 [archaeon]|nr:hypothetical protein [archaeon]